MDIRSAAPEPIVGIRTLPFLVFTVLLLVTTATVQPACACYQPTVPKAETATLRGAKAPTFGIDKHGRMFEVDADNPGPIPPSLLAERVRGAYAAHPEERVLYVIADAHVEYSAVLSLVSAARQVGVREIGLIAECPRGRESLLTRCRSANASRMPQR